MFSVQEVTILQLSKECFQVTISHKTFVGDFNFIESKIRECGKLPGLIVGLAGTENSNCTHEYVEMGFFESKMVCKTCDSEKSI